MIGKLKIDKSSVDMNYFLQAIMILHENGGRISRYQFERQMDIFQHGKSELEDLTDEESKDFVRINIRTQYNKSKLPRYYGFIGRGTNTEFDKPDLILTKRGAILAQYIEKRTVVENEETVTKCYVKEENKNDFVKLIFESVLYDCFGKNNCGMEQSVSDVEMPKVVLKTIMLLGSVTPTEALYIAYGMDEGFFESFDDAIEDVVIRREEESQKTDSDDEQNTGIAFMTSKVKEWGKYNFISDCKFITFFSDENINILNRNGNVFTLNPEIKSQYINELQQLTAIYRPQQLIISGVPGNGKSFYVEKAILGNVCNPNNIVRTIIHPEYTYSDFIGYIRPVSDNGIKYKFTPGPLVLAMERCINNPKESIYLIIEEINRGDFASIMGDTFQLLDRIDDYSSSNHGWSMYPIENENVYSYLKEVCDKNKFKGLLEENTIAFPSNLHIIGTMNTSDQNVFVLDTAFRRRFRNIYMKIDFSDVEHEGSQLHLMDKVSKDSLFGGIHTWSEFAQRVNQKIDEINSEGYIISEDKKLAPYFVNIHDLQDRRTFCDKVIYYLKNDVFLYVDGFLNESYEMIYSKVVTDSEPISCYDLLFGSDA